MDLERCLVSSSSSSSSLPSSAMEIAEDPMVEMELEAAEALADLAHLAMRENGGAAETGTNWGCKGKRVRKRGKTESLSGQSELDLNPVDPLPVSSDPVNEQTVVDQQQDQTTCSNVTIKQVKSEEDSESPKSSSMCTTRCVSMGGCRSRQDLTEAEKEERRIRRVFANRESARQTIRRRQALCEELTRKASDLVQENASLKKEKEMVFKEYQSLETINKLLKAQVAKTMKVEVGETGGVNSAHGETFSTSTNCPLLFYKHHLFSPLGWPPIIQSSLPVHSRHGQQKAVIFPSNICSTMSGNLPSSQEQENQTDINATRTPLYLVPCPWFLPLHDNENDIPVESSSDGGGGQHNGHHPREATLSPAPLCSIGSTFFVNRENVLQSGYCYNNTMDISKQASRIVSALPETKLPVNYPSKKLVHTGAAAEARKRRKEITKLKNLHGLQCRMHC